MNQHTIRGFDDELASRIRQLATRASNRNGSTTVFGLGGGS